MKHAGSKSLRSLGSLLTQVRRIAAFKEKKSGIFYCGPRAFLHFHEDLSGLYADFRPQEAWLRVRVSTAEEQAGFLKTLSASRAK
ncbi:MAG: hypothetical protein HY921_07110 [Elusimicrobia bacterium]|nr:hypothetical protein [Elusimicrobiota bacterium]